MYPPNPARPVRASVPTCHLRWPICYGVISEPSQRVSRCVFECSELIRIVAGLYSIQLKELEPLCVTLIRPNSGLHAFEERQRTVELLLAFKIFFRGKKIIGNLQIHRPCSKGICRS